MAPKPEQKTTPQSGEISQSSVEEKKVILTELRKLATSTGGNKQKILVQDSDSTMQYQVSILARPNSTPTIALSVLKIKGRGAWGIPLTSLEMVNKMIEVLQKVRDEYGDYVQASNELYNEDVKKLKGVVE